MKVLAIAAVGLVVTFVMADLIYAGIVRKRQAKWEANVDRNSDGVRRGCEAFTVGSGDTALLMVHGFNDSPALYKLMADELAEKGYTCRAMRLPGFAEPYEAFAKHDRQDWLQAIAEEVTSLRQTHDEVWIVGHSTGASLVIRHVLDHPDTAAGVALLALLVEVSGERSPVLSPHAWFKTTGALLMFTDRIETCFELDINSPEGRTVIVREQFVPLTTIEETFAIASEVRDRAPEITVPVYTAVSTADKIVDTEAAVRFFEQLGSARKQLVRLDASGHVIPVDYGWQTVCSDIDAFIQASTSEQ